MTALPRRTHSAPLKMNRSENIVKKYNYWESDFEKVPLKTSDDHSRTYYKIWQKNPESRKLKLQRILVQLGFSPDDTKIIVSNMQTDNIAEGVQ